MKKHFMCTHAFFDDDAKQAFEDASIGMTDRQIFEMMKGINYIDIITCPSCNSELTRSGSKYLCCLGSCQLSFPIVKHIPVFINEKESVFDIKDFEEMGDTTFDSTRYKLKNLAKKYLPSISANIKSRKNYKDFAKILLQNKTKPRVLIIGGGITGSGMQSLLNSNIDLIETDVSYGPRTQIIADAHNLPFKDNSFDGLIVQAVLEHVVDPYKVTEEIHRVLKDDGLVYAETPFMQQVHMAPYDFTRFTFLGHIRLFRKFVMLKGGAAVGPGSALAWSIMYFFMSFTKTSWLRYFIMFIVHLLFFWIKFFDYLLINKSSALDAASGYYFIFRKRNKIISDKDIIKYYRGGF